MRKITTKIIADLLIKELDEYNNKMKTLTKDFSTKSEYLRHINNLIIKFPNLQVCGDNYDILWTPEVNYLAEHVNIKYDYETYGGPVYATPYIIFDGCKIRAFDPKQIHTDDEYKPFIVGNKNNIDFRDGITECEGWKENMRDCKIPEKIITNVESHLNILEHISSSVRDQLK